MDIITQVPGYENHTAEPVEVTSSQAGFMSIRKGL